MFYDDLDTFRQVNRMNHRGESCDDSDEKTTLLMDILPEESNDEDGSPLQFESRHDQIRPSRRR